MTVLTVVSPKGGCGKTTVAVNLAVGLARRQPSVLVDFDVHFGDVEYALRLHPVHRLDEVAQRLSSDPNIDVGLLLTNHSTGVDVLCAPSNPVDADGVAVAGALAVVDHLIQQGRPMVIDTAAGIDEFTLGALERATHHVVVTGTDVASVQAGRKLLDTMTQLQFDLEHVHLVINRATQRTGLTVADVEAVLGIRASLQIPDDPLIAASMNSGTPFIAGGVDGDVSRAFNDFVGVLTGQASAPKRSWYSRKVHR